TAVHHRISTLPRTLCTCTAGTACPRLSAAPPGAARALGPCQEGPRPCLSGDVRRGRAWWAEVGGGVGGGAGGGGGGARGGAWGGGRRYRGGLPEGGDRTLGV